MLRLRLPSSIEPAIYPPVTARATETRSTRTIAANRKNRDWMPGLPIDVSDAEVAAR